MNEMENVVPLVGQRAQVLKAPASLAGHLTPDTHVLAAIVVDGDAAEIQAVTVASGTFGLSPRTMRQAQGLNDFFRGVLFGGK